jgi:hypothetical protein
MITEHQREALAVLAELCELSDDIRFGQLVAWLSDMGEIETGRKLADIDDDQLLVVMHQHRANLVARLPESEQQAFYSGGSSAAGAKP